MVKAPRSKGCRCDQEQPTCLRCRKAGRQCPGYQTISFVDEGPSIRDLYKTDDKGERPIDRGSPPSLLTSSGSRPVNSAPFEYLTQEVSRESGTNPVPDNSGRSQDVERSALVSILSPTAYQSQLLSLFLGTVVSDNPVHIAPTFNCHSIWLAQMASRTEVSSTLNHAIRAISLSFLGRQTRDKNLVQNSRLIYGKTLLKLNKSLQDPTEGLDSDTLSATVLLTFYELLNCTEHNSWVRHAGGAAHLMQLRGVARHRTEFDKAVFLACRYSIVLESYHTGKPCFLSLAPWRKLSQEIHDSSASKSAFEDAREAFFQEIVQQPGYVMDAVHYMASGGRDRSVLQDLVRRGHMHRSNHKAIHKKCVEALTEAGQEPTEVPSSVDDKVFPTVYQYHGILVASFFCCYWTLLKVLNIALIGLEAKLSAMESTFQMSREQMTPAQKLAARNMMFSRETLTSVIVEESTPPRDVESAALTRKTNVTSSGETPQILPDRTSSSPVADVPMRTRSTGSSTPAATSPSDCPTMSPNDTAKRRAMYMAENKHCAHQICKSVENVSTAAFLGPIFIILSLKAIGRMLDKPEEKEWVLRKMAALGKTWGLANQKPDVVLVYRA
ncbi:hypothetical protein HO133_006427 [Letharia lupina]|uniref:Zn(2)-C6 fungal-type domain-containing protein n=1 Tax=Letharia lupina TaxID=560253 RepID=A0A8H6F7F4_9LECA|nr:uncharacterized protein HO133_006427 [Letharia lupina]KAF6218015.1 hypothetical protein HO133_006427 [Letharia lupina]